MNLSQINLVVRDMPRSLAFYRRLGLTIDEGSEPAWARHHASARSGGVRLEFDSDAFARQWDPGWKGSPGGGLGVLIFDVPTREDVDRLFATLTQAGAPVQQPPEDAFWGARYAIVEDPDGNPVGLMSPIDADRRFAPPPPPGSGSA
jgi:catechol 2,3-dioxygenase-like lactoylglutathione lyase family enzyme